MAKEGHTQGEAEPGCHPSSLARVQVTTRMLRQGAQTRETEGSHHCARGIPEQRATDTRGKRRDSNLGPRSRKTCHLHPQTEAQETAGTKATFSFTRS